MKNFEKHLTGGHPNSLGNTIEVVEEVLANPSLFEELFNCYFSHDEVVRLRTSNAMKRVCKVQKSIIIPYIDRFLEDISKIDQASTQWTLASLFKSLEKDMSNAQIKRAKQIMKHNLAFNNDWIVLNTTIDTLGNWSKKDNELKQWLLPHLTRLSNDTRKSVSKRALKALENI